jgi:hypothetical protein
MKQTNKQKDIQIHFQNFHENKHESGGVLLKMYLELTC